MADSPDGGPHQSEPDSHRLLAAIFDEVNAELLADPVALGLIYSCAYPLCEGLPVAGQDKWHF
jgi:hypothetical protein